MPDSRSDSVIQTEPPGGTLSIVVPAYNEASGIAACIKTIVESFHYSARFVELIVIDDGSRDDTPNEIRRALDTVRAAGTASVQSLRHDANLGKGAAVRTGLAAATGDRILICDADLSTPLEDLARLETALNAGYDIAIGSRDLPDSRLDPPQPLQRRLLAWSFRFLRRRLLLPEIRDTQCGFKLLTRQAVKLVLPELRLNGWLFDCELLAIATMHGLRIHEVAVTWRDRRESRVRPIRHLPATLRELLALRRRFRRSR